MCIENFVFLFMLKLLVGEINRLNIQVGITKIGKKILVTSQNQLSTKILICCCRLFFLLFMHFCPGTSQLIQIYSVDWTDVYDTYNIEHRTEPVNH